MSDHPFVSRTDIPAARERERVATRALVVRVLRGDLVGLDLRGADLSDVDCLSSFDLRGTDLRDTTGLTLPQRLYAKSRGAIVDEEPTTTTAPRLRRPSRRDFPDDFPDD
jgi:hypothetical protein